jgi:peptidoglycan/xylan/chitin deacetylase (PgdA/CDA1 family)
MAENENGTHGGAGGRSRWRGRRGASARGARVPEEVARRADPADEDAVDRRRLLFERVVGTVVIVLIVSAVLYFLLSGTWKLYGGGDSDSQGGGVVGVDAGSGSGSGSARVAALKPAAGVTRPERCRGYVALTFDDGPFDGAGRDDGTGTAELMQVLTAWGVPGTFFFTGAQLAAPEGAEGLRVVLGGGAEVGNHSWTHSDLAGLSREQVRWELEATAAKLQEMGGGRVGSRELWRPPYGSVSPEVLAEAERLGLEGPVLWTVDTKDWQWEEESAGAGAGGGVEAVVAAAARVRAGGILLMHDGRSVTVQALPQIIQGLWERGLCPGVVRAGAGVGWTAPEESPALRFRARAVAE